MRWLRGALSSRHFIKLDDEVQNPYSLSVMQRASEFLHDILHYPRFNIEYNALYVRFYPSSTEEYVYLTEQSGLELFDYPLDRNVKSKGTKYQDPKLPRSSVFQWLYTTIYLDESQPLKQLQERLPNLRKEIIEYCYIPVLSSDSESSYEYLLEKVAWCLINPLMGNEEIIHLIYHSSTNSFSLPQGAISVFDNHFLKEVPLMGVKVRVHHSVKWASSYTDEEGRYTIPRAFIAQPYYSLLFSNSKGFSISHGLDIARTHKSLLGYQDHLGFDYSISEKNPEWSIASINNIAYEYYGTCEKEGLPLPPPHLKIWQWDTFGSLSSAPMLKHLNGRIGSYSRHKPNERLQFYWKSKGISLARFSLRGLVPDILIGKCHSNSMVFANVVSHELAHASHFVLVGEKYWSKYISFILSHKDLYGNPYSKNSGICAIGEMWGYAMGNILQKEKYGYSFSPRDEFWFKPIIVEKLISQNLLTKAQVLSAMQEDVRDTHQFMEKLLQLNPPASHIIRQLFSDSLESSDGSK